MPACSGTCTSERGYGFNNAQVVGGASSAMLSSWRDRWEPLAAHLGGLGGAGGARTVFPRV